MNFSDFFDFLIVLFAMLFHYLLDLRQPGPIKPVLLLIIGWLVGWLVMQFSEKRLQGFF